jgi:hypothetical protein
MCAFAGEHFCNSSGEAGRGKTTTKKKTATACGGRARAFGAPSPPLLVFLLCGGRNAFARFPKYHVLVLQARFSARFMATQYKQNKARTTTTKKKDVMHAVLCVLSAYC